MASTVYTDSPAAREALHRRTLIVVMASQVFSGAGLAAGVTVGALLAADLLGTSNLSGLPTALFTAGSAGAALMVGRLGTAMITDALPLNTRARTQGTVDLCVALAGAGGGIASGMILSATSYATLALGGGILALAIIPLVTRRLPTGVTA
ncbi:hypothetical protein KBX37_29140 [Micromonospora sp. U56]|uniref:hypothetical protein n=1 Tax=Micromonospora sp. U56 TaxID=2824900 RepID=UPI001B370D20|nr:hypothetical protein [Micromonospora sp. U56]MBQ0897103.1 hypothetical protein [Micromonospora sp. U56]